MEILPRQGGGVPFRCGCINPSPPRVDQGAGMFGSHLRVQGNMGPICGSHLDGTIHYQFGKRLGR